ncbi:hypothetical protein PSEUDO9AG_30189 [Pseudomonas sp. 9Ag]|nr:hypothetical protein PSEUDO9AG_30189 [Pseudomonas sp. 9Ag]
MGRRARRLSNEPWSICLTFAAPTVPRGLSVTVSCAIIAGFSQRPIESCRPMEINPILNSIKDLSDRTQSIRGYL